jgi:protein TonB
VLAAALIHAAGILLLLLSGQAGGERLLPVFQVALVLETPPGGPAAAAAPAAPIQPDAPPAQAPPEARENSVAPAPQSPPAPAPVARAKVVPAASRPTKRTVPPVSAAQASPQQGTEPGTVASSPGPGEAASAGGAAAVDQAWEGELMAWLQAHKSYPAPARERAEEGAVTLGIVVARDGRVLNVVLAAGSGFEALDGAAVAMLRNARLPPFPAAMTQSEIMVKVPLRYTLER